MSLQSDSLNFELNLWFNQYTLTKGVYVFEHLTPDVLLFIKSIAVGFVMCVPIGPVSILIMRKTVSTGPWTAIPSACGSMCADIFYSVVAGFGIATVAQFFTHYQKYLQLVAVLILLLFSIKILRTKSQKLLSYPRRSTTDTIADFTLGFFVVLLNPIVLFVMTNLLTIFHVNAVQHTIEFGLLITSGIFIGEGLWWAAFISATHYASSLIGKRAPVTINTFTGLVLLVLSTLLIIKIAIW